MSLQVWLPLNGNITNQGTSNLIFTNLATSNTTSVTGGKVTSSAYNNNSYAAGGLRSNTTINLGSKQSMFCWFKFTNLNSNASLGGGLVSQHRHASNTGMGITIKYISSTTGYLSINTGNGSSRTYNTYCGTTLLQANTWYHGGYTYDGNTIKIYLNGVCENTISFTGMSVPADYITIFGWSMSGTSGSNVHADYKFNGKLNDVRVYDHCLSTKEVKMLARGLCVHYPLSVPGENLLVGSGRYISSTQSNKNKDGYFSYPIYANNLTPGTYLYSIEVTKGTLASGHSTSGVDYTKGYWALWLYTDSTTYSDSSYYHYATAVCYHSGNLFKQEGNRYYWKVTITSDKPNCAVRINTYSDGTNNAVINFGKLKLESGNKETPFIPHKNDKPYLGLPLDGKSLVNSRNTPLTIGSSTNTGNYQFATFTPNGGGNYPTRVHRIRFDVSVLAGSITQVTCLFYNLSTSTSCGRIDATIINGVVDIYHTPTTACPNLLIYAGVAGSTANKSIQINNLRVYNEFVVEDTSGYNNNATKIGAISFDSNTPRYNTSMVFNGTSYLKCLDPISQSSTEFSISAWIYLNNITSTMCVWNGRTTVGASVAIFVINSTIRFDDSNQTTISANLSANTWYHIVGTWKSGNKKTFWINGSKISEVTAGTLSKSNTYASIGMSSNADSEPSGSNSFNGKISDVRIYSTCLTENDIKELYHTAASIDNAGNVYSFDYIER